MALGKPTKLGGFLEGDQVAEIGLDVFIVRLVFDHSSADYRSSGRWQIIEQLA
jgi:hypothetical protein